MRYQLYCVVEGRDISLETEDRASLAVAAAALHRAYGVVVQIVDAGDTGEDGWVRLVGTAHDAPGSTD